MKQQLSIIFFVLISTFLLTNCSKDSDAKPEGNGTFEFKGRTYSGKCMSIISTNNKSNINVVIQNPANIIVIYNMPKTSSGTVAFVDGFHNINSATDLYAFVDNR